MATTALRGRGSGRRAEMQYAAWRRVAWPVVAYGVLTALAVVTLIPIVWMVLTAFKSAPEVAASPPTWVPREWHPENFQAAWNFAPFGRYLLNTAFMAGAIMVLEVLTSALAAYAFARLRFRRRDLHWVDTYQGLIIPQAFSAFGTFLLRQFFLTIPHELEDAARIDGATRFGCFARIILPLSGPALATLAVFVFLFQWNNLLWPLVISNTDATRPIAVGLRKFLGEHGTDWNLLMAAATLATLPVVALYLIAQRWFVRGIALSGLGGR